MTWSLNPARKERTRTMEQVIKRLKEQDNYVEFNGKVHEGKTIQPYSDTIEDFKGTEAEIDEVVASVAHFSMFCQPKVTLSGSKLLVDVWSTDKPIFRVATREETAEMLRKRDLEDKLEEAQLKEDEDRDRLIRSLENK